MTQDASVSGSGNVVVQIIGDRNEVALAGAQASLRLTRYANRRSTNPDELDFLSPYSRALPLVGRKPELAALTQWLDSSRPVSIAVWVGLPGTGKTRLALELVERASAKGWSAGFVRSDELARFTQQGANWVWNRKTLIVVDDPVKQAPTLARWFETLADDERAPRHPLRILIVERHADQDSGWWQTVFDSHGHDSRMVRRLLDPERPVVLSRIADPDEQRQIFSETLNRLQATAKSSSSQTATEFNRAATQQDWLGEPLFLITAALVASSKGLRYVLSLNRTDLAHELAKNERDRIKEIARTHNAEPTFLVHMAAIVSLARGMNRAEARAAAGEERAALSFTGSDTDPPRIVDVLAEALVTQSELLLSLTPDILAEAFILLVLRGDDGLSAVLRAGKAHGKDVAITTIHIAQDYIETERLGEIRHWFSALIDARLPLPVLLDIADAAPSSTIALKDEVLRLQNIIVEQVRDVREAPLLAMSLNNLGNRLNAVGRRDEALAAAQEAVNIYRELAETAPDAFRPNLAMSLNNLGNRLAAVGQRDEALATAQEAVNVYRELAETNPDAFRPDLAMSLNNLGNQLDAIGQRDEALAVAQETTNVYRELTKTLPDAFRPNLAGSLNNLGNRLDTGGRRDEALAAAQEALNVYRELTKTHPDAFRPDLAMSLNNLGGKLDAVGLRDEALAAAQEAVTIRRELAEIHPNAFRPDLAMSLNNLGNRLDAVGRRDEALAAAQEAVNVYRELVEIHPDAFRPYLASSLNNLGNRLDAVGRRDEALAATQEAVNVYRELVEIHLDAFRPDLAGSLNNLGNRLNAVGRREEALAAAQEALNVYRELAETHSDAFRPNLAASLNNLGNRLNAVGRRDEALAAAQEAVNVYRELAETYPDAFGLNLAASLNNLGVVLDSLGHQEEALAAVAEAAELEG